MKERNYGNFAEKETLGSARSTDVTLYLLDSLHAEKKKNTRLERKVLKLERQIRRYQGELEAYENKTIINAM